MFDPLSSRLIHFYACLQKTFQDSYIQQQDWMSQLVVHTYYLIPLVLDSVMYMRSSFASWMISHNYIVNVSIRIVPCHVKSDC